MFDFLKSRSTQIEIMDDFECDGEVVNQTLKELHSINTYLGGVRLSVQSLARLIKRHPKSKYSIIDLGCGGGDTIKHFASWGKRKNLTLDLIGIDANQYITNYAKENCLNHSNVLIQAEDIFSEIFRKRTFDIAHCSLFLHHFTEKEIIILFKQLKEQVNIGIIINDLHRHPISYYFTKYLLTVWSKSEMVKFDSVVSVARSFKRKEIEQYLKEAEIKNYSLKWKWAFRWELVIKSHKKFTS